VGYDPRVGLAWPFLHGCIDFHLFPWRHDDDSDDSADTNTDDPPTCRSGEIRLEDATVYPDVAFSIDDGRSEIGHSVHVHFGPVVDEDDWRDGDVVVFPEDGAECLAENVGRNQENLAGNVRLAAVGDVSGDGSPDLAVGSGCSMGISDGATTWVIDRFDAGTWGTTSFESRITSDPWSGDELASFPLPAGDVNGDGTADVLIEDVIGGDTRTHAHVVTGPISGTVRAPYETTSAQFDFDDWMTNFWSPVGDVDGDGLSDLALTHSVTNLPVPSMVYLFPGCEDW
jgi:hypothetical protein